MSKIFQRGGKKKMLNGRQYGRNPFSVVQEQDPEFVEWGYGGMGSVKHGTAGSERWKAVQASSSFVHKDHVDDNDDGSGMAWVKRKRQQREMEKLEKGKKEDAGQVHAGEKEETRRSSLAESLSVTNPRSIETTSLLPVRSDGSESSSDEDEREREVTCIPFLCSTPSFDPPCRNVSWNRRGKRPWEPASKRSVGIKTKKMAVKVSAKDPSVFSLPIFDS
jgi:hypothetical protein